MSNTNGVVDIGTFSFSDKLIVKGNITTFTVVPQSYKVGDFPVFYDFTI